MGRHHLALALLAGTVACSEGQVIARTPPPSIQVKTGEDGSTTPAGALQGNWRVMRADDPNDGAILRLQIIHDGDTVTGDYVLFQPFCWIDRPLPQPLGDDCEFTDASGPLIGSIQNGTATLRLQPGADRMDHRITLPVVSGDRADGTYVGPHGDDVVAVVLERQGF